MKMQQVSDNCFAVLNEKNRICDANSGLINRAGGVVIDTQSDLAHARQMIDMFSKVWLPCRGASSTRTKTPTMCGGINSSKARRSSPIARCLSG